MQYITDLHIHSRFSRATSIAINIKNLEKYAKIKGVNILGTGDFTHPEWIKEIKEELTESPEGILLTKNNFPFILQTEISLMFAQGGKGRRIHLVVLAPSLEVVNQITQYLLKHGRIDYDGRPIFNISCAEFTEKLKEISQDIEIIPAHIWTPWFGVFGSKTGFNSLKEAFLDQEKNIHAIETGLSSDPSMNYLIKEINSRQIISSSDAHSFWPWRLGREATIFELKELTYKNLIKAIRTGEGLKATIEVDPAYGKYHYDGHRNCNVSFSPEESLKINRICPICKTKLTVGVDSRVKELADNPDGFKPKNAKPFYKLLPLHELISKIRNVQMPTKKCWQEYNKLIEAHKNEYNILLRESKENLLKTTDEKLTKAILQNREGKIKVKPGYDGVYGEIVLETQETQKKLF